MESQNESELKKFLTEIADAIREVRETKELINAQDLSSEIRKNIFKALPIEVYTEEEMTALLVNGEAGSVYKYIGTTGTYENGTLYIRVEPTLETSDGYYVVDSEGSIISLKVTEFIKLILKTDLEDITITENGEYSGEYSKVTVEVPQPQLYAPTISIDGDVLTIIPNIDNGAFVLSYDLYIDDVLVGNYSETSIDLATLGLSAGTYSITAITKGTNFVDSVVSNSISYEAE